MLKSYIIFDKRGILFTIVVLYMKSSCASILKCSIKNYGVCGSFKLIDEIPTAKSTAKLAKITAVH